MSDTPQNINNNLAKLYNESKHDTQNPVTILPYLRVDGQAIKFSSGAQLNSYVLRSTQPDAQLTSASFDRVAAAGSLTDLYHQVLGRSPDTAGLATYESQLQYGASIDTVRVEMAASPEAIKATAALYQSVTGIAATPMTIQALEAQLAQPGATLDTIRKGVAFSANGKAAIDSLYTQVLGRPADSAGEAGWQGHLASGMSLADVRTAFAASPEAISTIGSLVTSMTGTTASGGEIQGYEVQLTQPGETLDAIHGEIAATPEAVKAVDDLFTSMTGSIATDALVQPYKTMLAQPYESLSDVRTATAASQAEISAIAALSNSMIGGTASAATIQLSEQDLLRPGTTLNDARTDIASSKEAIGAIGDMFTSVTGRVATGDTIQTYEKGLLAQGETFADVRSTMAHSAEGAAAVENLYSQELGRASDPAGKLGWEDHLGTDMTLAQVRAGIADSTEAGNDIRGLDLYASGQTPTNVAVAGEQATLSQGGSLSGLYSSTAMGVGAGFIGSQDQYNEALRQIRLPGEGVDSPLSTLSTGLRNVLDWAARKAPELGAVGAAAAILLTPTNTQQTTTEVGVAGDPDLGARYTRAPGSLDGTVTLYARGPDGQPVGDGITLQASAEGQLTGPPGSSLAGVVFGTLPPGNIFEGVQLAPGLVTALGLVPTASGMPQPTPGSGIEVQTQEEADLVASMQAQGKSTTDIQAVLDALRNGRGGVVTTEGPLSPSQVGGASVDPTSALISKQQALINVLSEIKQAGAIIVTDSDAQDIIDNRAKALGIPDGSIFAVTYGDAILVRPEYENDPLVLREELIHVGQQTAGMTSSNNAVELEISAREQMIANSDRWGITPDEVDMLQSEIQTMKDRGY